MMLALWIPGVLLLIAAAVDLKRREIPDVLPIALLGWAVLATACGWLTHAWWEVVAGAATGLAIGAVLFRLGGFGGGDAKLLAGLGAVLGPRAFLVAFAFIAVAGGVFALIARLRSSREHAYAPAIAVGYVAFVAVAGVSHGWI
jgi:prepilin peptidase CpaA